MIFKATASNLLEGLNIVTRALPVRSINKATEYVLFETDSDSLTMTCTDGSLTIQTIVSAEIEEPGNCLMPGRLLADFVRKLPDETILFSINQNFMASIRCGKSRSNISGLNPADFPEINEVTDLISISVQENTLKKMISKVIFSAATTESKQIVAGVLFEQTNEDIRMVALDGFRLAIQMDRDHHESSNPGKAFRCIIPTKTIGEISKIITETEESAKICFDSNCMRIFTGRTIITSTLLNGSFMDYRRIIKNEFFTKVVINKQQLLDSMERASLLAREGRNNVVRFKIKDDTLVVSSKAEQGNFLEDIPVELSGEPIEIAFNPKYVIDAIKNIDDDDNSDVQMNFRSNMNPMIIRDEENQLYLYLILPIRV